VTAISNITWTMLWVYIGCSIENIIEVLKLNHIFKVFRNRFNI